MHLKPNPMGYGKFQILNQTQVSQLPAKGGGIWVVQLRSLRSIDFVCMAMPRINFDV